MARKKEKTASLFWRITISLVGAALILLAVQDLALFFWGETSTAQVSTRRMGGARDGAGNDDRYSWSISYTFTASGKSYQGHTSRRGSALGVKVAPEVYYFTFFPHLNSLADQAQPGLGQLVLVGLGILLLVVMNKTTDSRKKGDISIQAGKSAGSCPACGSDLAAGDLYCAVCGSKKTEVP